MQFDPSADPGKPVDTSSRVGQYFEQTRDTVLVRRAGGGLYQYQQAAFEASAYGNHIADMLLAAMMSEHAYGGELSRDAAELSGHFNQKLEAAQCTRLVYHPPSDHDANAYIPGLYFEFWKSPLTRNVFVAFRGSTLRWGDWTSNFRAVTRFFRDRGDHYDQLAALLPSIDGFLTPFVEEGYTVTATGHSLGGGLAQHLAYSSTQVARALVFDPSPVTGWFDIDPSLRDRATRALYVARISEKGEILATVRNTIRKFVPLSDNAPQIEEFRVNFLIDGIDSLQQHSIAKLAEQLVEALGSHLPTPKGP